MRKLGILRSINQIVGTVSSVLIALITWGAIFVSETVSATVIRADFQPNGSFTNGAPVNFTGVESKAAAANSVFGTNGSNTWNHLTVNVSAGGTNPSVTSANPAFGGLLDSTGAATSVGLSFIGNLLGADDKPIDSTGSDALENDYFFIGANSSSTAAGFSLTGLPANTPVTLFLYAPNFTNKGDRGYSLTANGSVINVASGASNDTLATVISDTSGIISGSWSTAGNEGDWAGFQAAFNTPEPASFLLPVFGGAAAFIRRRR